MSQYYEYRVCAVMQTDPISEFHTKWDDRREYIADVAGQLRLSDIGGSVTVECRPRAEYANLDELPERGESA